jgi:hypothetical protein
VEWREVVQCGDFTIERHGKSRWKLKAAGIDSCGLLLPADKSE